MAVRCRSCRYLIEDQWAENCALCGAPIGGGGGGNPARPRGGASVLMAVALVAGVVAVVFGGSFLLTLKRPAPPPVAPAAAGDSTGKIRVGMPMTEVAGVLDAEADRRKSDPASLTQKFPEGLAKSGALTWGKNGRELTIAFERGRVVQVVEETGAAGAPETFEVDFFKD